MKMGNPDTVAVTLGAGLIVAPRFLDLDIFASSQTPRKRNQNSWCRYFPFLPLQFSFIVLFHFLM